MHKNIPHELKGIKSEIKANVYCVIYIHQKSIEGLKLFYIELIINQAEK